MPYDSDHTFATGNARSFRKSNFRCMVNLYLKKYVILDLWHSVLYGRKLILYTFKTEKFTGFSERLYEQNLQTIITIEFKKLKFKKVLKKITFSFSKVNFSLLEEKILLKI